MVWLWIALAAVLAAALLLLGAAVFFFKFSIRRYRKERADEPLTGWSWRPCTCRWSAPGAR